MGNSVTPIQEINDAVLDKAGIRLLVKREDLNHPLISGNKFWKLKYNIGQAKEEGYRCVLTFGGAYSNHLFATAAAAAENDLRSVGVVRGERIDPLNPTLSFVRNQGMHLEFISRSDYRNKNDISFTRLREKFGDFYVIPEGGTNVPAVRGCAEFADEHLSPEEFDVVCLPVGTGGTMAGLIAGLEGKREVRGIAVLKNGNFLEQEIRNLVVAFSGKNYGNWSLLTSYHHGGYARKTRELLAFVSAMKERHNLPLDHVYTGKLMWAVMKEAERGSFSRGSTVLALHTGGLQAGLISA